MDIVISLSLLFIIIFIYVIIITIFIYFTYFSNINDKIPPRNELIFKVLINKKQEIIKNINIYTYEEINNNINSMIELYIKNKCDFIEDYGYNNEKELINNYKLQKLNHKLYNILKKQQIINNLKYELEIIYKKELSDSNSFDEYKKYLDDFFNSMTTIIAV